MGSWSTSTTKSSSTTKTQEQGKHESSTKNVLDEELLNTILGGLTGQMTPEEIAAFAENLMKPQLSAGLEAAQQGYETTKLGKEQEIENLSAALARSIEEQNRAYRQSVADVETAALARGMGRSSYTLDRIANQGNALADAIRQMTEENTRQSAQIQQQISQAAQHNAQTQGRLNTDYAAQLAAKIQELTQQQRQEYNSNYLTAVSASMGQKTEGTSSSEGQSQTDSTSTTTSSSGSTKSGSSGGGSAAKKTETTTVVVPKSGTKAGGGGNFMVKAMA